MARDMGGVVMSKPSSAAFRRGWDQLKRRRGGSGICRTCRRYPCVCRTVFEVAGRPAENRGGRARLYERKVAIPAHRMPEEVARAVRVLGLAESRPEKAMFASLLRSEGQLTTPDAIKTAWREVEIRKGV